MTHPGYWGKNVNRQRSRPKWIVTTAYETSYNSIKIMVVCRAVLREGISRGSVLLEIGQYWVNINLKSSIIFKS